LSLGEEQQIYCTVKVSHRARFSRSAHQSLLKHTLDDCALEINGETVRIGRRNV